MSRTEYYSSGNDVQWEAFDYSVYTPDPFTLLGEIDTSWTTYKAGDVSSQSFRGQPTHPRLLEHALFVNETVCPVCATATNLDVLAFPFGDNSATHRSYPDSPTAGLTESTAWSVKADGKVRQSGTGVFQSTSALASGAKAYSLTYNETRSSTDFLMSTDVKTTWTVKTSAPQADLPAGWVCSLSGDTDCTVLPVMTNDYQLPVNLLGQIKSGDATGTVNDRPPRRREHQGQEAHRERLVRRRKHLDGSDGDGRKQRPVHDRVHGSRQVPDGRLRRLAGQGHRRQGWDAQPDDPEGLLGQVGSAIGGAGRAAGPPFRCAHWLRPAHRVSPARWARAVV